VRGWVVTVESGGGAAGGAGGGAEERDAVTAGSSAHARLQGMASDEEQVARGGKENWNAWWECKG